LCVEARRLQSTVASVKSPPRLGPAIVDNLLASRRAVLHDRRARKMARSAHAFVRGSTERFYEWLASPAAAHLPVGPKIWICGDCHVGNLGPVGNSAGRSVVELRDLDQTTIGNPAFDLVRLALSLAMAARGADLPGVTTARLTEDLVTGYERAFEGDVPSEEIEDLPRPIRTVMRRAVRRTWRHVSAERLGRRRRRVLPLGKRFWPLSPIERKAVAALVEHERVRMLVTDLADREAHAEVRMVDAAYWIKGCSSLGLWRVAALVEVQAKGAGASMSLLDLKEATDSFASRGHVDGVPADPAARVVAGAKMLAPALGNRMVAARVMDHSVFVRELLPQDLKIELDHLDPSQIREVAHYLGAVVGRAHGRQLAADQRRGWRTEMLTHRTKNLDAPSWLWNALVQLVAVHEHAYLEHCRRYALAEQADSQTR
jgi:uncharacterized protein (DUF2252 family)